jgi:tRNA pseudouridine55 synthase
MESDCLNSANFWLNVDKPEGYSSAKVVAIVKKITGSKKVGHSGTLDPFATGVLPIAVGGKATKTCGYIVNQAKKYYCEIAWGEFRDSDDKTGEVIKSNSFRPTTIEIINALPKFVGKILQVPSSFSAIKVNGQKSYDLARKGVDVKLNPRLISIKKIKLVFNNYERAGFEIVCSKGTYVRSFAKDLAREINACGYVDILERTMVGDFLSKETISLAKLKNIINYGLPSNLLLRLRDVLNFLPEIDLNTLDTSKLKNGQLIELLSDFDNGSGQHEVKDSSQNILTVKVINGGSLVGLATLENGLLKPLNNF